MIKLYTDGGCRTRNREISLGASVSVQYQDGEIVNEVSTVVHDTTNQQTELLAVIIGLDSVYPTTEPVFVYSDSAYVVNCFKQGWHNNWKANGWKSSNGNPVKNRNLWEMLIKYVDSMNVEFIKVKGHSNTIGNNRADELANIIMDEYDSKVSNVGTD